MEAPGLTSPTIQIGMMRSSEGGTAGFFRSFGAFFRLSCTALFIGGLREVIQLPLPDQALGVGFAGNCSKCPQVRGIVNVERDAGQRK